MALMDRETRVRYGPVPHGLSGEPLREQTWHIESDRFLLRGMGDHWFHYRKGEGITIERGANADVSEESLWLNGTLYSAIASINGLMPIHASAVAHEGRVFAFTGPGTAGKSTLVAALGRHGLPMFCDDTLVLDLSDPQRIECLPGHKRLKLTESALRLSGAVRQEQVSRTVEKFYALPAGGDVARPLPLAALVFLCDGPAPSLLPVRGGRAMLCLQDDHYTSTLFAKVRQDPPAARFALLARFALQVDLAEFARPRDSQHFDSGVALIAEFIRNWRERAFSDTRPA